MSINVIASEDTKALANKLKVSLQSTAGQIQVFSPDSFLKLKTIQSGSSVDVLILTALSWQEIQRLKMHDVKRLFSKPKNTVLLWSCAESVKSAAIQMFSKTIDDWRAVGLFEASGEEWFNAEARIKYRLSELGSGDVHIPGASKYIIKPDAVSHMSESEVLILLFEADHPTDVDKLKINVGEKLFDAKKIQSNVWSFCASDFTPGDHEIRVFADDVDLGTDTLHVQDRYVMMKNELGKLKQENPERFLAELLKLDLQEFDRELEDYIIGSSCVSVIEKLLKYGDEGEYEYPTFLHFCSKYGLESCINWCRKYHPNFKQACMVENKEGKTPEQLATDTNQNQLLIQVLQTRGSESEELKPITSAFKKTERFSFQTVRKISSCPEMTFTEKSRDSGCSSLHGSGESLDRTNVGTSSVKTGAVDEKKRYNFGGRAPHPYSTIDDGEEDRNMATYNRPWDSRTLLANRSAQALSAGELSRSFNEMEDTKRRKPTRSNTTAGGSTTKM